MVGKALLVVNDKGGKVKERKAKESVKIR